MPRGEQSQGGQKEVESLEFQYNIPQNTILLIRRIIRIIIIVKAAFFWAYDEDRALSELATHVEQGQT